MREIDKIYLMEEKRHWHSRERLGQAMALYDQILCAYDVLTFATNESGQPWEGRARPLYLMESACRYNLTMAMMTLFRGHTADAYYQVRCALDYAGTARLMRAEPDLEKLWVEAEANDVKMKEYQKRTPSRSILPESDPLTAEMKKRYAEASSRIHSSSRSMLGKVKTIGEDADMFCYFDVDKRDAKTLFEPYMWINSTHLLILSLFDSIFAGELSAHRDGWEKSRQAAVYNMVMGYHDLLDEEVPGTTVI